MIFVKIEDFSGSIETVVFPSVLKLKPAVWQIDQILLIDGRLSDKDGMMKVLVNEAWEYDPNALPASFARKRRPEAQMTITVPAQANERVFTELKELLAQHPGTTRVLLTVQGDRRRTIETHFRVAQSPDLVRSVEALLGEHTIAMNRSEA